MRSNSVAGVKSAMIITVVAILSAAATSGCSHTPAVISSPAAPASPQQQAQVRQQYVVQLQKQLASIQSNQSLTPKEKLRVTGEITAMIQQFGGGQ